jgi:hypothetical protein
MSGSTVRSVCARVRARVCLKECQDRLLRLRDTLKVVAVYTLRNFPLLPLGSLPSVFWLFKNFWLEGEIGTRELSLLNVRPPDIMEESNLMK